MENFDGDQLVTVLRLCCFKDGQYPSLCITSTTEKKHHYIFTLSLIKMKLVSS